MPYMPNVKKMETASAMIAIEKSICYTELRNEVWSEVCENA